MSDTPTHFTEADLARLNRIAHGEGWEVGLDGLTIRRRTTPPDECRQPEEWKPSFCDDYEARVYVCERSARDLDQDPAAATHQLALRVTHDLPEMMLLSSAVVRARRAGLDAPPECVDAAVALALRAVMRHSSETFAWAAASSEASRMLPELPNIADLSARLGSNSPQDDAAAALFNCVADFAIATRRAAQMPAPQLEEADQNPQANQDRQGKTSGDPDLGEDADDEETLAC